MKQEEQADTSAEQEAKTVADGEQDQTAADAEAQTTSVDPDAEQSASESSDAESADAVAQKLAAAQDRLIRLQADFDNFRKRQARDRADLIRQSNADLIEELLPTLDHISRALEALRKDSIGGENPYLKGFDLVQKSLVTSLGKFGLSALENPVGKPLDPNTSEALSTMTTGSVAPGAVLYQVRQGYMLNGKLLRAAQVVVEADPDGDAIAADLAPTDNQTQGGEAATQEA